MVATSKPTMEARSGKGIRSKSGKVAKTCPSGEGNSGISNAVLREQSEVRALRLVIQPGGTRAIHAHDDVEFHLFVPITREMTLLLDDGPVQVQPWHPYYLDGGTQHGFRNDGPVAGEVMEVFIR